MGRTSHADWDTIYKTYRIPKGRSHDARQNIRRYLKSYLERLGKPDTYPWDALSEIEKDFFIYIEIYEKMMKSTYVPDRERKNVECEVRSKAYGLMREADYIIKERNAAVDKAFKEHEKGGYDKLCEDIRAANQNVPLPTEDEFKRALALKQTASQKAAEAGNAQPGEDKGYAARAEDARQAYEAIRAYEAMEAGEPLRYDDAVKAEDGEKAADISMRAYDYAMAYENSQAGFDEDIARVYMRIILQVLEEKLGLKVDYYLIRECLSCQADFFGYLMEKGIPFDDLEQFPEKYEKDMGLSEEEYEERRKKYVDYLKHRKMLNDLEPLYTLEKEPGKVGEAGEIVKPEEIARMASIWKGE